MVFSFHAFMPTLLISRAVFCVGFQVEAPVARRSPHRPGLEDFPHPVPRFRFFYQTINHSGDTPSGARLCCPSVSQSVEVSLTRFVISKYLPSFPSIERRTRLHLPYSGSLGPHFPTFPANFIDHRYYVPLRLPKARLRFVRSSLSSPDTWCAPFICVSLLTLGIRSR